MGQRLVLGFKTESNGEPKTELEFFDLSDSALLGRPDVQGYIYYVRGETYDYYLVEGLQWGDASSDLSQVWLQIQAAI